MQIGIIGAGASGLAAAWLLKDNHNVTIFEKQNRLGGHAQTIDVEVDGKSVAIEAGFDFFTQKLWPTFYRLLDILDVPVHKYSGTTTLYTKDNSRVYRMPLVRNNNINWSLLKPDALSKMIQFQRALESAKPMVEAADGSITIEQFIEGLKLSRSFKDDFCYPLFMAIWCTEMEEFRHFSAYNALKYYVLCDVGNFTTFYFTEVAGGSRAYIEALANDLKPARIRTSAGIKRVTRNADRYFVEDAGGIHEFDHLVIATNAREAFELIAELDGTEALRRELSKVEYFKGAIAIHGDKRLMPANEKHWSVFNISHDREHSALTVWKKWKSKSPVFKSWVTYETQPLSPLYFSTTYDHPKVTPRYFEAQRAIGCLQGQANLWLAGLYTHDIDSHESAIQSAVKIARRLDPHSPNLNRLIAL